MLPDKVALSFENYGEPGPVVDANEAFQVLANLVANAIYATRGGGHIDVRFAGSDANGFVLSVEDNDEGMDNETRLRAMEPLIDFPGAFVLGSNDYFAPTFKNPARYLTRRYAEAPSDRRDLPVGELVAVLGARGWADLDNARTLVDIAGLPVELVGVNDPHIRRDRYAAVSAPASPDAALTIGLVHAPYQRVLDAMVADGAGLVIAGHTHGGQLALPLYGALVTNCDLDTSRAKGLSRWWPGAGTAGPGGAAARSSAAPEDAAYLHVSAGLGTSPYAPVRFACRPEATLLTLTARDATA